MLQKLTKRKEGFTIIEVMIVLAIAGLILLIVFLAVPALQRNSRNTQRKNDVAAIMAAVNEYVNNNSGVLPATCSGTSPITVGAATTSEAKVGYYNLGCAAGAANTNGHVGILAIYAATGPYNTATTDMVTVVPSARCNAGSTAQGSARQIAAVYSIENGSGAYASVCQES